MKNRYPVTWLVTEALSLLVLCLCLFHALQQSDAAVYVFRLLCFVFGACVFEHMCVLINKTYDYDNHRIMITGKLPASILFIV